MKWQWCHQDEINEGNMKK
ncbi:hypothetical protein E2C01_074066 [Portunus trituberculatus]|uniref:Uncharacterized protein n=1 Tax=Portunus trituberculatus TaxID=210409 RepID=A0A5B7IDC7_PORTR|nr:hypothetical protein [Portunus trituberculatus]